ncbi:hypothetical protein [Dyella telluris]|uniref:Uncharacterized protein n=1 Tax=Dyella telluris TaxID=2763498 RepID=A0A7G8Q9Y8_9GAMM|nr:hypothetical protein [Dyella telluris]QNK03596.1 hypothetical protein H8F01_11055 [Dyella telluris]
MRIGKAWPFCNTFRVTHRNPRITRTLKLLARRMTPALVTRPRGSAA